MKKQITTIFLVGLMLLSLLAGCGKKAEISYKALDYVTLGDYKGLPVSLHPNEITDEALHAYVEDKMNEAPYDKTDKTTAETGDVANINYVGKLDGTAFEGGTASGYDLALGDGKFIAGFEDGVIGMNVGETKDLPLTFPSDYSNTDLAGKEVVFTVTLNFLEQKAPERHYDDLTDDFVKAHSSFTTVQEFVDNCRSGLEEDNQAAEKDEKQSAVIAKLQEICEIKDLPKGLLEDRLARYAETMQKMLDSYGVTMDDYLANYNMTKDDYDKQLKDAMEKNLRLELILEAIAAKESIKIDEADYKTYIDDIVSSQGYADDKALYEEYSKKEMENSYLCDKALDVVMENAVVTYDATDNATTDGAATDDTTAPSNTDTETTTP
ncbi:trigger factor [Clostridia bacterium]|nr:trigger factor [Clostridia bacterium]